MKKKKITKQKFRPRLNFRQRLAQKITEANIGTVTEDSFNDDSSSWVTLRFKDTELCFSFDIKGEKLEKVELFQDIVEVTGQRKVWETK